MAKPRRATHPALPALLLAASLPLTSAAQDIKASPDRIQRETPASVRIEVADWQAGSRLLLLPGGPVTTHRLELPEPPRALASDGRHAWVAGPGGLLRVIALPATGPAREIAQARIDEGEIQHLRLHHGLLMAVTATGVTLLDAALPEQTRRIWSYHTAEPVTDLQLDDDGAWLLLGERRLAHLPLDELAPQRPRRAWQLPLSLRHIARKGDILLGSTAEGLASLDLGGSGTEAARLLDRLHTGGDPQDLHLQAGLALLDAGPAGLQIIDASEPARLRWLGSHARRGPIAGLAVYADRAWVGTHGQTLQSIALGNPEVPAAGDALRLDAPLLEFTARGDVVVAATTRGLQRLDFANPAVADLSPEGLNLGGSRRGVIRDGLLYVADWFSGLHIYDIRDPAAPRHIGNYHTPGSSKGVALYGHYALVGDDDYGLQIIDVADPRRPRWVAELNWTSKESTLGLAYTMKVVGDTLYLADHRGGFQIIDLSDIERPRILGALDTPGKSWAIDVSGHTAYVADDDDGLLIVDVSDPGNIRLLGRFSPGGHAEDVVVRDGLAYVAFFDDGLHILDVGDPARPRPLAHLPIPGNARGITLRGDLAYVSGWESGLQVVDIADPASPRIIGHHDTDGAVWGSSVQDGIAYALDWWGGIKVLDVSDPARPTRLARYQARGRLRALRAAGNYLFTASGAGGLQVYDGRNPLNPIWAGGADLPGEAVDLWLEDGRAYLATGDGGVALFDVEDPFYPRLLGRLDTPGEVRQIRARDDYLFIADRRAGLLVADARDPARPRLVGRRPATVRDLWTDDQGLLLLTDRDLQRLRVDESGRLHPAAHLDLAEAELVRSREGLLAVALSGGRLRLLREDGTGLLPLGRLTLGEAILDLQFDGNRLFVLGARSGLLTVDIRRPEAPRPSVLYPATAHHDRLLVTRGAAFLGGERRMASVNLLPPVHPEGPDGQPPRLDLPKGLPAGRYHLLLITPDGQHRAQPDVLTVSYGDPARKRFNLEAMRRMMKRPPAPPPGAE